MEAKNAEYKTIRGCAYGRALCAFEGSLPDPRPLKSRGASRGILQKMVWSVSFEDKRRLKQKGRPHIKRPGKQKNPRYLGAFPSKCQSSFLASMISRWGLTPPLNPSSCQIPDSLPLHPPLAGFSFLSWAPSLLSVTSAHFLFLCRPGLGGALCSGVCRLLWRGNH